MRKKITDFDRDYAFLSNFYPSPLIHEGLLFGTVEHGYQAMKSLEPAIRAKIQTAPSAGVAKRLGNAIDLRPDWDDIKKGIMLDLLRLKFRIPSLKRALKNTGDAELIEGNTWHDNIWGVCICPNCARADKKDGLNWLGELLTKVREELRVS